MTYTIKEDVVYKNFITSKTNATESTIKNYEKTLKKFCKATNETLENIVSKCKNQQEKVIEKTTYVGTDDDGNKIVEKTITRFDVNSIESYIKIYFDTYINYCKSRGNKNTSINLEVLIIKAFFKHYNIITPSHETLENDTENWNLLTKEDFNFIMSDSPLMHQILISFLKSTGMRLGDALTQTIGDFMENTSEYHNYINVEEFIDNAPSDMIGTWEFYPKKTKRHQVKCITFNDPETSNLILQYLRKLKNESIPLINKKYNENNKLSKQDPLFGSKRFYFKKAVTAHAISNMFSDKNKKFREYRIALIKEKIKNNEIAIEDFEKEVEKIPRFHAHACRKYFETMIARNCGDLRICAILEGHTPPMSTDSSYIKIDIKDVKEAYMSALEDLSLENTEVKVFTSEIRREMEAKIDSLVQENESLKQQYDEKEDKFNDMEERLSTVEKLFSNVEDMSDEDILKLFSKRS